MKPPSSYTLTPSERKRFTEFFISVRFPDGFAGNLKKNVTAYGRLTGLNSHDCHDQHQSDKSEWLTDEAFARYVSLHLCCIIFRLIYTN